MHQRRISVTEFKARCFALLDEVGRTGSSLNVTRRGRPIATVGPVQVLAWKLPEGMWAGKVTVTRELSELDGTGHWDALEQARLAGP